QSNAFYTVTNRIINVLCGFIAGVIFIPVAFIIYILNLLASRGPLFYSQERVGKNGSVFTIYKFRTMIPDAEINSGPQFASLNDPRITKIGRWLRKTRLDEMPQFWNILKGDMNLIGPRPERKIFVDALSQTIPFFKLRNAVKPGLTGWAQVNHKYASDSEDSLIKLQYDLYYIKHRSFTLDLWIVLRTIGVVIKFKGT
ncbi:MAG TPA: sugar transferase, partial [Chitinophagales bacterium]|nr:sugar transferase [Chitinophagales bacterium]